VAPQRGLHGIACELQTAIVVCRSTGEVLAVMLESRSSGPLLRSIPVP
jgi:hypothetical protein